MRMSLSLQLMMFVTILAVVAMPAGAEEPAAPGTATQATPPDSQPVAAAKLHCQVFNQAGMGIAGSSIEVTTLGMAGWVPLTTELTDRTGECDVQFAGARPTLLQLKVSAKGYQDAETLYVPRTKDVIPWLAITLKGARSLEGRVVTQDKQGVAEATVVFDSETGTLHTLTTESGAFWFDNLAPIRGTLVVQVPGVGIGAYPVDLTAGQIKPVEIVLRAQRRVMLRVIDTEGKPLPGVLVEVLAPQGADATTDGQGQIPINGMGTDRGVVVVSLHDDYYRFDRQSVALKVDRGAEPIDLEVTARYGGLIEGQVVEKETGEPIPAAVVWFVADGKPGPNMTCDSEGKFRFEAIPEDTYLVAAGYVTCGFAVASANVEAGKKAELKLALPEGSSIQGVVTDASGKPIARAIVRATTWVPPELAARIEAGEAQPVQIPWRAVRTNDDGEFQLTNLPVGRIDLEAADPDGRHPTGLSVEVPENKTVIETKIHLKAH